MDRTCKYFFFSVDSDVQETAMGLLCLHTRKHGAIKKTELRITLSNFCPTPTYPIVLKTVKKCTTIFCREKHLFI